MQVSRRQGSKSKILPQAVIEEKLEQLIRVNGEEGINAFRDRARELAEQLGMQEEFGKLNRIISALLSTKQPHKDNHSFEQTGKERMNKVK